MSRLSRTIRRGLRDAAVAVQVAPVEVALGVTMAVGWSFALADTPASMEAWFELATLCLLTGGIAWIATLLHGLGALSDMRRWLLTLGGFAVVVVYDVTLLDFDHAAEVWRALLFLAAVALAITLVPAAASTPDGLRDRRFREVNLRMLTRLIGVTLYAGALYLGLSLAISAVSSLFELELDGKIYGHVFGAIAFGLAPWIFVGGAPGITAPPGPTAESTRIVRRFGVFLFVPLLVVYYLILYAYLVRIAVTGELPRNLVSPMVLAAGLIAAVGVMMFAGAQETDTAEEATVPRAIRLASPLFLPLAALGFWAIALRVAQYGWTEFRYMRIALLVALLVLAALGSWALIRRRRLLAYPVSLVLGVTALLCALGPWSATATARRSQQARLAETLRVVEVDTAAAVPAGTRPVADSLYQEIRHKGSYLADHFGDAAVAAVAGHAAAVMRPDADLAEALGLEARQPPGAWRSGTARFDGALATEDLGDGELYVIEVPDAHRAPVSSSMGNDSTTLHLSLGGRMVNADLAALVERTLAADSTSDSGAPARERPGAQGPRTPVALRLEDATLPLRDDDGRAAGRFVVRWLAVDADSMGVRVRQVWGLAVVPRGISP